jgi:hypothetical protein
MPDDPMDAMVKGSDWMNKLLMAPVERRYKEAEMEKMARESQLAQQSQPLKLDLLRAQIESAKSLANQRAQGGGSTGGSVGYKDQLALINTIKQQYGVDDSQARDMANQALSGQVQLSGLSGNMLEQVIKRGTTAGLVTQGVRAAQAEAEMPVIDQAIEEGRKPYGSTVMGISLQQIKDSLNTSNEEAQQRLGNYIASDMLGFDKAALQTRMAGTESGVTIINEAMDKAKQTIKAKYPMLSDKARSIALKKISSTLNKMLKARQSVGISPTTAMGFNANGNNKSESSSSRPQWKIVDGELVRG